MREKEKEREREKRSEILQCFFKQPTYYSSQQVHTPHTFLFISLLINYLTYSITPEINDVAAGHLICYILFTNLASQQQRLYCLLIGVTSCMFVMSTSLIETRCTTFFLWRHVDLIKSFTIQALNFAKKITIWQCDRFDDMMDRFHYYNI